MNPRGLLIAGLFIAGVALAINFIKKHEALDVAVYAFIALSVFALIILYVRLKNEDG